MPYALVVISSHPKETLDQQTQFLRDRIVPMVQSQPGFVSAYWAREPEGPSGCSYVRFTTLEDAQRMQAFMKEEAARPNPLDVKITSVVLLHELATASS